MLSGNSTVLVVEDEALVRMAATGVIEDAGWKSLEAGNAQEALKVIAEHPEVTVLFTDVDMPGPLDGIRLAEWVHRDHPKIELVITSGQRRISEDLLPDHGTFLLKPYGQAQLVRTLKGKICSFAAS